METVAAAQSSKLLSAKPGLARLCWWHLCLCGLYGLLEWDRPHFLKVHQPLYQQLRRVHKTELPN